MSLYLLGTDPPGQPEGAPWLGAPIEDMEIWRDGRKKGTMLSSLPVQCLMEPLWVPLESLLPAAPLPFSMFQHAGS